MRELDGNSPMKPTLAALEMELEALKQGSDDGGSSGLGGAHLAAAIKQQTEVLKDTLASRGNQSSITAVKDDLVWFTLTADRNDTRGVSQFYEEFEERFSISRRSRGSARSMGVLAAQFCDGQYRPDADH